MAERAVAVLLRGVNLGGRNRLPIADLRRLLEGLGVAAVRTHLQSGNAVGSTGLGDRELAAAVTATIADDLDLRVPCVVIDREALVAIVDGNPLLDVADDHSRLQAIILDGEPDAAALTDWRPDDPSVAKGTTVATGPRVVYQWCPDGIHRAPNLLPGIERHWELQATARNWRTVTTLLELLDGLVGNGPGTP